MALGWWGINSAVTTITVLWSRMQESPISPCYISQNRFSVTLGSKDCSCLALFQVPKPMFLLPGWPQSSVFTQPCFSAFSHFSDSTIPQSLCFCCPSFLPWSLSGIFQVFSCLSTATVTAVTTRAACSACLPLLPSVLLHLLFVLAAQATLLMQDKGG